MLCHVSGSYTYVEARDTELWGSSDEKMQNADVRDLQAVDRLSVALLKEEKEAIETIVAAEYFFVKA